MLFPLQSWFIKHIRSLVLGSVDLPRTQLSSPTKCASQRSSGQTTREEAGKQRPLTTSTE